MLLFRNIYQGDYIFFYRRVKGYFWPNSLLMLIYKGYVTSLSMDNQILFIFLWALWIILLWFYTFIYMLHLKVEKLEKRIKQLFVSRSDAIPGIFEISKKYLNRHGEIFKESIRLRKTELALNNSDTKFYKIIETEWLLHHELNFIFKVCNKHSWLTEDAKFNYIKEVIVDKSSEIGIKMNLYKSIAEKLNTLIKIKNWTWVWLFFPIEKKVML